MLKIPQLIISIKLTTEYALKSVDPLKPFVVFLINRSRQTYYLAIIAIGDIYGLPAETHANYEKQLERDFQISIIIRNNILNENAS